MESSPDLMASLSQLLQQASNLLWGPPLLILIGGTGIYLTLQLRFLQIRKLGYGIRQLLSKAPGDGTIAPFSALMTSLSATIGTGNIAGVATAIHLGGPGALFWMWVIALFGMATKYAEGVCAVHFREVDHRGEYVGGPMYYIRNGMGYRWRWLGVAFAFFGAIAAFGIGNTVQANSVAAALGDTFGVSHLATGIALALMTALVIFGGIRAIARAASAIVPVMAIAYILAGLAILALNAAALPGAFVAIFHGAFSGTAATGGFAGATLAAAIRFGMARGIFSNEAGLGSAPMAHASARTSSPVRQGTVAMLGTFIDTLIICTITGLAIVVTGVWTGGATGAVLSAQAFEHSLPDLGNAIVALGLAVFAFTTLLGWSVYGERCVEFLLGERFITPFRVLWVAAAILGAMANLQLVWQLADVMNALMALPNLIALLALSPVVWKLTRTYFADTTES